MGLRPKPRGGFAARANLGAPPQTPVGAPPQTPLGAPPQTPQGAPPPHPLVNEVWGGALAGVYGRSPQLRSCGEATGGAA